MFRNAILFLTLLAFLTACADFYPRLAPKVAQPRTPVARNFTSFSTSLRCVDEMLAKKGRGTILISSNGIPDRTKKIYVGADDMLVNAINHMNRFSQAYVFVDQPLERDPGQLAITTLQTDKKKLSLDPRLYVRGSISQLDSNVVNDTVSGDIDLLNAPNPPTIKSGPLRTSDLGRGKTLSVVTVDMHLVAFPSRRVIPGSSVANSMVVTGRSYAAGASGLVRLTGFDVSVKINRVESQGQAVRNLIELGTIELLGRHAGIPYWECLNIRTTNQKKTNEKEIDFTTTPRPIKMAEVQRYLIHLGYYKGAKTGLLDLKTRNAVAKFQADQDLIATGEVDFDLFERLKERARGFPIAAETHLSELGPDAFNKPTTAKTDPKPRHIEPDFRIGNPENTNPPVVETRAFSMRRTSGRPQIGSAFRAELVAKKSGTIVCYHQQDATAITQITPLKPGTRMRVQTGQRVRIPLTNTRFDILFDKADALETITCIFDPALSPLPVSGILSQGELSKASANTIEKIVNTYRKSSGDIDWLTLSARVVSPNAAGAGAKRFDRPGSK